MIKKILICLILCLSFMSVKVYAGSNVAPANIDIPSEWTEIFDDSMASQAKLQDFSLSSLFNYVKDTLKLRITQPIRLFMRIAALLIFASLSRGLCPSNGINNISSVLDTVITLAIFGLCSVPILELIENMILTLESNKNYLAAFVPVFSSVLASCGQVGSAAVYSGFFFGTVMLMANILCIWALPAIRVFFALCVMDGVCTVFDFSKLTSICVKAAKWILTICAAIFVAVLGLQSTFADAADTVAMRTGKMILSASVPVIGRAVSDAMGSVYAGLKMLKGTAGAVMVGGLAVSFAPLLIEAAAYYILLNLSAMIATATGNTGGGKLFSGLAEGVSLSMLFLFFFATMAILSTIIMILLGGGL